MLDVLVTISSSTPVAWVRQALRSAKEAAGLAKYPVRVIEVPGVPGHIGQAMLNGAGMGDGHYIAWVDDDDWVLPNAFSCLERHFASSPPAVCAREIHLLANGHINPCKFRHHLTAWRRDVVEAAPLAKNPAYPLVPMLEAVKDGAVDELSWVYMRRIRRSGGMAVRRQHGRVSR